MRALLWIGLGVLIGHAAVTHLPLGTVARTHSALQLAQREQARLESLARMDRHAQARLQLALARSEAERAEQARRLAVYERVLQPVRADAATVVEDVAVYQTGKPQQLRYRLVLSQGFQRNAQAIGRVQLSAHGHRNGVAQEMQVVSREYRFRYLHVLEGTLQLPADFQPDELRVRLKARSGAGPVQRAYAWGAVYVQSPGLYGHAG